MYITLDILVKRGACKEYLEFFDKHYPNGVEMLELIKHGHLPYHGLHWGYKWLDPNEEEVAAYWERVQVVDSEGIDESDHVTNSMLVVKSSHITQSQQVYHCEQITKSCYTVRSKFVDEGVNIVDSDFIDVSSSVLDSKNVSNSNEVVASVCIANSHGIYQSNNIINSHAIWQSNDLTNCGFCFDCNNLTNALFCIGANNGEHMLFNKSVDKMRFDMIYKQFTKYASHNISLVTSWDVQGGSIPSRIYDYREHTKNISASFWDWVKTLPGYDASILYSITFNPFFLK
jgi:hypothetical protein